MSTEGAAEWRASRDAHKEAQQNLRLSDPEFIQKANFHAQALKDNRTKLASIDKDKSPEDYAATEQAMTQNLHDIRELYHPEKNPGAVAKFGHLITDKLKLTNPADRAAKADAKTAAANAGDVRDVKSIEASLPLSPEKKIARQGELDSASMTQKVNNYRQQWKSANPEATPQEESAAVSEYIQSESGIKAYTARPLPGQAGLPVLGPDGKYRRAVINQDGSTGQEEMPAGWKPPEPKKSTSAYSVGLDSYAASHGYKSFQDLPERFREAVTDYQIRKQAMDRAIPTSTTSTQIKLDAEGQLRPLTVTSYKTPGGNVELVDPMSFARLPQTPTVEGHGATVSPSGTTAPSAAAPKHSAPTKTVSSPKTQTGRSTGNIKVGAPLFAGKSKELDDAQTTYDAAVKRAKKMDDSYQVASKSGSQQDMLNLLFNHIGMTQGAQKGARINQKSIDEAKASAPWIDTFMAKVFHKDGDDWVYDGLKTGVNLTPQQMKQMVDLAHESVEREKESLDTIRKRLGLNPAASDSEGQGKKHRIKIGDKTYEYKGSGDTEDLNNYTEVKK